MQQKLIQEQFGQELIDAVAKFAKSEISSPDELGVEKFDHVADHELRRALAETLYGARWLYKLGLALLVSGDERSAHVRMQVIDYASICEALLADMILQAQGSGKVSGDQYKFTDFQKKRSLDWNVNPRKQVHKTTFEWRIKVSEEFEIIDAKLANSLNAIRGHRNTVHLTQKIQQGVPYYIGMAQRSFNVMNKLIKVTRKWRADLK